MLISNKRVQVHELIKIKKNSAPKTHTHTHISSRPLIMRC